MWHSDINPQEVSATLDHENEKEHHSENVLEFAVGQIMEISDFFRLLNDRDSGDQKISAEILGVTARYVYDLADVLRVNHKDFDNYFKRQTQTDLIEIEQTLEKATGE